MLYLLGLDAGTSGCKAMVFDYLGKPISSAYREYSEYSPEPGWTELDPNQVWLHVKESIRECITGRVPSEEIEALSLTVLGEAVLPIDREGNSLYPAITAYDARANGYRDLLKWWKRKLGAMRLFKITGIPLNSMPSINKILWIRENMPEIFSKAWKFVCVEDYIICRLSGEAAIDYSLASKTMMMDIRGKRWSSEILEAADLDEDLLSKLYPSGTVVAEVHAEASEETGLKTGTPVVAGAHDQVCAALGVGVIEEGPTMNATGSVECITSALKKPVLTEKMFKAGHNCICHAVKDMYVSMGWAPSAGIVFRWYRDLFAEKEREEAQKTGRNVYDILTGIAADSPPGASKLLLLPHFYGTGSGASPAHNRNCRGAFVGLSLFHKKADVIRSILEGIGFELRQMIEHFEDAGIKVSSLRATGGGAKSPLWLQIKADITNKTVVVPQVTEAASLGASILAGVGAKIYRDFDDAIKNTYRQRSVYQPRTEMHERYSKQYSIYREIYPSLLEIFDRLSTIQ